MRFHSLCALLLGATVGIAAAPEKDADKILKDLQKQVEKKLRETNAAAPQQDGRQTCTLANVAVRRDWYVDSFGIILPRPSFSIRYF